MANQPDIEHPTKLPHQIPVMVLPDCHLFPGCLLPLYIFEERYRLMLEHLLNHQRIFCIGNRHSDSENDISPYSTAGLIRACVKQPDGTSHLLLLGLQRIKITNWTQHHPYRIATIQPLTTQPGDHTQTQQLKTQVLNLFAQHDESARQLRDTLTNNHNLEQVADILSYHFTRCPTLQQKLLAENNLQRRYEIIHQALSKHKPH